MKRMKVFTLAGSFFLIPFLAVIFMAASPSPTMAKPIELSFATHIPPKAAPYHSAFGPWAKEI